MLDVANQGAIVNIYASSLLCMIRRHEMNTINREETHIGENPLMTFIDGSLSLHPSCLLKTQSSQPEYRIIKMHLMLLICALISVAIAQNVFTTQACVTERGCGPFPTTSPAPPTTRSNTIHSTLTRVVSVCPTATVFVFNSTSTTTGTQTVNSTVVSALRVTQTSTTTTDGEQTTP
jgi:hypothetical protein